MAAGDCHCKLCRGPLQLVTSDGSGYNSLWVCGRCDVPSMNSDGSAFKVAEMPRALRSALFGLA